MNFFRQRIHRVSPSPDTERVFDECKRRSDHRIDEMRQAASDRFAGATDCLIGISGSFARREATQGSDVDLFFLATGSEVSSVRDKQAVLRELLKADFNMKLPAIGGVFHEPLPVDKIFEIGGLNDDNATLTRRMLLLLEGEWVFGDAGFHSVRRRLLEQYLHHRPGADKICMFLLNDVIRYWRTICIDLEHKVRHNNKARDIRLIKLRFSRMLLYASGVLAIGEGYDLSSDEKLEGLQTLLGEYPIDRIRSVVGEKAEPVLDLYADFLTALDTPAVRQALEEDQESEYFIELSDKAGLFRDELHSLFEGHFGNGNPTLRAVLL